jgi:O-antigen biosynthesis protein WbqP
MQSVIRKRVFDLVIALFLTPFAIFICLLAAICVTIECRSSPFFWQSRLGLYEKPFSLLKLRSMHVDTVQAGSHEIGESAILKTGTFIRKLKLDELPQLWNVLRGEMSLVGPRPGLVTQYELAAERRSYGVFKMLPGITGISQISKIDMSTPRKLSISDAVYSRPWTLKGDLRILARTILGSGMGDAARK